MKSQRFKQVDVFTDQPFLGNPVAVVIGAEALGTAEMQRIAGWTNLSETTFLLKSTKADYRLRIFTPRQELPFAGHPTIGSAHAALESGFVSRKTRLVQECGAGLIELSVEADGRIFLKGPSPKIQRAGQRHSLGAAEARDPSFEDRRRPGLGGRRDDRCARARRAQAGHDRARRLERVARRHRHDRVRAPRANPPARSTCAPSRRRTPFRRIRFAARGNLSVARPSSTKQLPAAKYIARQGMQMGRDGRVYVRIRQDHVQLGGHAVTCVDGTIAG